MTAESSPPFGLDALAEVATTLRQQAGLTGRDIEKITNFDVDRNYLYQIETGRRRANPEYMSRVFNAFGYTLCYVLVPIGSIEE